MGTAPIIITGGGSRLGFFTAMALQQDGHQVIITYRKSREELKQLEDAGVVCMQADFSTQSGIDVFLQAIKTQYSSLRGIIHNASEWLEEGECEPHILMEKVWQIHMNVPYQLNMALAELLQNNASTGAYSDIIHITDYVAENGSTHHIAYAASKAGLANLTLSFAKRFAPRVKVNSLAPALLAFNESDDLEYRQERLKKSLLKVEPGFDEAIKGIRFILQSNYMTGRALALDGGRHLV
ncbi:dihydromonapterin reductase [Marinomonas agarivorans]|nr:dihydromonapterin reductase [Marinomonas agarivorans]